MSFLRISRAAAILIGSAATLRADLPPNFLSETISVPSAYYVGLTFAADGRMILWENSGVVWTVVNGERDATPLLDIREEVGNWGDHGLLGVALDPNFLTNGLIYVAYVVDYHHLMFFGTPEYDPEETELFTDTLARVTRYACDPTDGFRSVLPQSRHILIGESVSTGIPICFGSHGIGTLVFGDDGTLLVGTGDGASFGEIDTGGPRPGSSYTALADGIIQSKEDIGAYRSQLIDSHSGKVLRINPATGDGVPSNPFFDALYPRSPRSRVWAMGFRNPYRFTLRAGSGSADPADADPGTLFIGDVGWSTWEELNVCKSGGRNYGWPIFEGLEYSSYQGEIVYNADSPNPLGGANGCPPLLQFEDVLIQDSLFPLFPNPCDAGASIPPTVSTFVHARPTFDWLHQLPVSRTGIFDANGAADTILISDPSSPIPGPAFGGSTALGGAWYAGSEFPAEYQNTLFAADYSAGWIRSFAFDADDNPVAVRNFGDGLGNIVCVATNPLEDAIYYIAYVSGGAVVRRISHVDNFPPVVAAIPAISYGPVPHTVQFSTAGSYDPEGGSLSYVWDFGDGSPPSTLANPVHTYSAFPTTDISEFGDIVGRVFELVPPSPIGGGNPNREIIRDNVYPALGSNNSDLQFDTFHAGDQGDVDWIGYEFAELREFRSIIFQEGIHFWDGGWFDTLEVQVFRDGAWQPVPGATFEPPYAGNNDVSFERYAISFPPISGTGIRLYGDPGGVATFISVGEIRVFAASTEPVIGPTRYDVTLTVTDELRAPTTATMLVSVNNTPPRVEIVSPANLSRYSLTEPTIFALDATIADDEHLAGELLCQWQTALHHNEHYHPEPFDTDCVTQTLLEPIGCDGNTYFYRVTLTVTDSAGLRGADGVQLYPACCPAPGCEGVDIGVPSDCVVGIEDLAVILSLFGSTGLNLPGDTQWPFDEIDLADLAYMLAAFGRTCQ